MSNDEDTPMNELPKLLTPAELSALIGVSEPTLCNWRYLRKGPKSFTLGRRVRYCEADVIAWINEERRNNPDGQ